MPENISLIEKYESKQVHSIQKNGLSIEEQIKLSGHEWNISCLEFSQNGLFLASGSWDKTLNIWDLRTLDSPKILDGDGKGHKAPVTCLSWLPHIEFLLCSGSADRSLLIWNTDTGDIMARYCFCFKFMNFTLVFHGDIPIKTLLWPNILTCEILWFLMFPSIFIKSII